MKKHQIALCDFFVISIPATVFLLWISWAVAYTGWLEQDSDGIVIGVLLGVLGLLLIAGLLLLLPFGYFFDEEGVTCLYLFLPNERYLWDNIRGIEERHDGSGHDYGLFDWLFSRVFEVCGTVEGPRRFYMQGHIYKTHRTKRLIEKYWDGTIGEYESIWRSKKKSVKKASPLSAETVSAMERQARTKVRALIKPFSDQAAQYGLELTVKYLYITKDYEEFHSRPEEGYTYTVEAEIARPEETDEGRILVLGTELLFVRRGKTAYRGNVNEKGLRVLQESLDSLFQELREKGWDTVCAG